MSTLWPEFGKAKQWLTVTLERATKNAHVIESDLNEITLLSLEWTARTALELEKSELCTTVKNGTSSHWKTVRSVTVLEGLIDMPENNSCPDCLGCGIIDLSTVACPACKGTGKVDPK